MKVLVVDDSRAMRMLLSGLMSEMGYESVQAVNGQDALDKLSALDQVDLALVDWNMPVMDGLEFIKQVRAQACFSNLPLVVVTTEIEMAKVEMAMKCGANEYIMKPFTKEILAEKLQILGIGH